MASAAATSKEDLGEYTLTREASPFVKLISAEGHEFYVDRKCALVSGTIKSMLQSE
jgi:transcription elongation factor B subunit 1